MTRIDASLRVDRDSSVPIYHQIKQILLTELRADSPPGARGSGRPYLTERELVHRFGVSRAPVRQALKELTDEGYLYRERSKGTFAMPVTVRNTSQRTGGLLRHLLDQGLNAHTRVTDVGRVRPPERIRALLGLPPPGTAFTLRRLIILDGKALASGQTYIDAPPDFAPSVAELECAGSVLAILERDLGVRFPLGEQQIWATAASAEDAWLLEIPVAAPILVNETTMFTRAGQVGGWSRLIHVGDDYKYVSPWPRGDQVAG